jgi:hypothetical protein
LARLPLRARQRRTLFGLCQRSACDRDKEAAKAKDKEFCVKRILLVAVLSFLALHIFAGDLGFGVQGSFVGYGKNDSYSSQSSSQSVFSTTVSGVYGLPDGWEVNPFLNFQLTSYSDPNVISSYTDGLAKTTYGAGVTGFKNIYSTGSFRVLLGVQGNGYVANTNKQFNNYSAGKVTSNYSYSSYQIGLSAPISLEYRATSHVAFRVSNLLATTYFLSEKYDYSTDTITMTTTNFVLCPTGLSFGIFYFF